MVLYFVIQACLLFNHLWSNGEKPLILHYSCIKIYISLKLVNSIGSWNAQRKDQIQRVQFVQCTATTMFSRIYLLSIKYRWKWKGFIFIDIYRLFKKIVRENIKGPKDIFILGLFLWHWSAWVANLHLQKTVIYKLKLIIFSTLFTFIWD